MTRLIVAPSADADVTEIFKYLATEAGFRTAVKYMSRFDALYDHLQLYPESCPRRPALGPEVRIGIVSPYVVIYRYAPVGDRVVVLRVVHGRRRITGKLLRPVPVA